MLGAPAQTLPTFNETINLSTTGAGGMDTGAPPDSGYVAIYAIYNPTTHVSALLATNATAEIAPSVYGGAYMPVGYTSSALVSVWPTSSTGMLNMGLQIGRTIEIIRATALNTTTPYATYTALSLAAIVPPNAKSVSGVLNVNSTSTTTTDAAISIASTATGIGLLDLYLTVATSTNAATACPFGPLLLLTPQELYFMLSALTGTLSGAIYIASYTI
jgi:hypothetical protein